MDFDHLNRDGKRTLTSKIYPEFGERFTPTGQSWAGYAVRNTEPSRDLLESYQSVTLRTSGEISEQKYAVRLGCRACEYLRAGSDSDGSCFCPDGTTCRFDQDCQLQTC